MHCYRTCGACPTRRADRDDLALTGADQRECDARSCLLTELRWEFLQFRGHAASCWLESPVMVEQEDPGRDLAGLVVPLTGRLVATGDRWEPCRLLDASGVSVGAARAYFGHLQAAGRS